MKPSKQSLALYRRVEQSGSSSGSYPEGHGSKSHLCNQCASTSFNHCKRLGYSLQLTLLNETERYMKVMSLNIALIGHRSAQAKWTGKIAAPSDMVWLTCLCSSTGRTSNEDGGSNPPVSTLPNSPQRNPSVKAHRVAKANHCVSLMTLRKDGENPLLSLFRRAK